MRQTVRHQNLHSAGSFGTFRDSASHIWITGLKSFTFTDIRFGNILIQGGGRISLDGLDASHHLGVSFHNVVADQSEAIRAVANHADIQLDGSNLAVSGEDIKVTGAPTKGTLNACDGRFAPFPVPISVK